MHSGNSIALALCVLSFVSTAAVCAGDDTKPSEKVLRHAVFFKFKNGTSEADVGKVVAAFDALPKKIDSIAGYQRGKNVSPLGFDDGLTHCFLITFKDEAGRAKYLPHPEHKAFGNTLRPHLEKVFVIDYWGKSEKALKDRELKHALFLKFKKNATAEHVKEVETAIEKLAEQTASVKAFEWGKNNSPEKHDEGFTHCFMFTFNDLDGLKKYALSPEHQQVVAKIHAISDDARVLDFWTRDAIRKKSK